MSSGGLIARRAPPKNGLPDSFKRGCSNDSDRSPAAAPTRGSISSGPKATSCCRSAGLIPARQRYERRDVYDYTYVLHDLHLNSWVLAYRRALQDTLLEWHGETAIEPPTQARNGQIRLDDNWTVEGLRAQRPRTVVPDAVLEIARPGHAAGHVFLVEYDRTTRVDKNYEKFRRYDAFLSWWWRHTQYADRDTPPWVLFVCQNEAHRDKFLAAADHDLTGRLWHPSATTDPSHYVGRRRTLFTCERDVHDGVLDRPPAAAVPAPTPRPTTAPTQRGEQYDYPRQLAIPTTGVCIPADWVRMPPPSHERPRSAERSQPSHAGQALLTAGEVAQLLGVPPTWVYEQSRAGRIPTVNLGRYRRYRREAIEAWLVELEQFAADSSRRRLAP